MTTPQLGKRARRETISLKGLFCHPALWRTADDSYNHRLARDPEGRSVRVVRPVGTAVQVALLFGVYSVLAVAVAGTAWLLLGWRRGDAPSVLPAWPPVGLGVALMLFGPPVLWTVAAGGAPWERAGWTYGGVALFVLGWTGVGAGLRPSGSAVRGLLLAVALYVLVGLVWVVAFNVGFLAAPVAGILRDPLSVLLIAAMWPLNVAQAFGLFGHSFN